ncbi:MAG: hypothetical protein QM715_01610 [Nibricoccus sp.]
MKKTPIITYLVLETAPRTETGAYNIGWPPAPDLVEASEQSSWPENITAFVNAADSPSAS